MATFDKTTVFADPFGSMLDGFREQKSDTLKEQKLYLDMLRTAAALQKALNAKGRRGRRTGKTLNLGSKGSVPKAVSAGSSTSLGVPAGLGLTGGGTVSLAASIGAGAGASGVASTPDKDTSPIFGKTILDRLGLTPAAEADPTTSPNYTSTSKNKEAAPAGIEAPVPFSASVTPKADDATLARGLKDYLAGAEAPAISSPAIAALPDAKALRSLGLSDRALARIAKRRSKNAGKRDALPYDAMSADPVIALTPAENLRLKLKDTLGALFGVPESIRHAPLDPKQIPKQLPYIRSSLDKALKQPGSAEYKAALVRVATARADDDLPKPLRKYMKYPVGSVPMLHSPSIEDEYGDPATGATAAYRDYKKHPTRDSLYKYLDHLSYVMDTFPEWTPSPRSYDPTISSRYTSTIKNKEVAPPPAWKFPSDVGDPSFALYSSSDPATRAFLKAAYRNFQRFKDFAQYTSDIEDAKEFDKVQEYINAHTTGTAK